MQGYNGTGVKDIVNAAGVPKGSFYNYFESKEAFAIAALEQVAEGNLAQMQRMFGDINASPLERIEEFFVQNIEYLKRNGQYSGGCFVGTICQEIADVNETIRQTGARLLLEYEKMFAECLQQAQQQGELASTDDVDALAGFIFTAWEGALLRMKTDKSAAPLEQFLQHVKGLLRL
jgi:TetR/AcrR family transcriptional repressor of nem operon